jgi:hypothetical protein
MHDAKQRLSHVFAVAIAVLHHSVAAIAEIATKAAVAFIAVVAAVAPALLGCCTWNSYCFLLHVPSETLNT